MMWLRGPQGTPPEAHRCDLPNQELRIWSISDHHVRVACTAGTCGALYRCERGQAWEAVWEFGAAWWRPVSERRVRKVLRQVSE